MSPKESNNKIMKATWDRYSDFYTRSNIAAPPKENYDQFLNSFFCPGQFYYYVVDFYDRQIKYINPTVSDILGLDPESTTFEHILDRIHPEDIGYVARTESASLKFMFDKVGWDHIKSYKTTYCFRFKVADGSYELFQNQSILLSTDENGRIGQVLHIHTNVSHITTVNNYMPSLIGIKGEKKVWPIRIERDEGNTAQNLQFSKREIEIIKLIALGYKSEEIADSLFISLHTVHTHRKNITRKSGVKTSSELISLCAKDGLI